MDSYIQEATLTAYALGELDEAELPAVEALLATDAEARQWVEDIRALSEPLTATLRKQLTDWSAPGLLEPQRRAIGDRIALKAAGLTPRVERRPGRYRWLGPALVSAALAACLTLTAVSITSHMYPDNRTPPVRVDVASSGHAPVPPQAAAPAPAPAYDERATLAMAPGQLSPNAQKNSVTDKADSAATLNEENRILSAAPAAPAPMPDAERELAMAPIKRDPMSAQSLQFRAAEQLDGHKAGDARADVAGVNFRRASSSGFSGHAADRGAEGYPPVIDNPFMAVAHSPVSTFAITTDSASYTNIRRMLGIGKLPPPGAVRIEQMINYFSYNYSPPGDGKPLAVHAEVNQAPWMPAHRLVMVGLSSRQVPDEERPAANLVFFIDVAGTNTPPAKVPLLKQSLKFLADQLRPQDRLAVIVYAGGASVALESTPGSSQDKIRDAIDRLAIGGGAGGGAGIGLAYNIIQDHLAKEGVNRVIFATDGDISAGLGGPEELIRMVRDNRKSGASLSVLSFGQAGVKNATLQRIADAGSGSYAYVDSLPEAQRVLEQQIGATLVTVARNVKIQVEFNPRKVYSYRLIGYENRQLAADEFNNPATDAGQVGAGQNVTALYEIIPATPEPAHAGEAGAADADLRYQTLPGLKPAAQSDEVVTIKVAYQLPQDDVPGRIEFPVADMGWSLEKASSDFRFAAAVAQFAFLLRHSPQKGQATYESTLGLATSGIGPDADGLRRQFNDMVQAAQTIAANEEDNAR